jgi:hypothetical protein
MPNMLGGCPHRLQERERFIAPLRMAHGRGFA